MRYRHLILSLMIASLTATGTVEAKEHSRKTRDIVLKQNIDVQSTLEVNIRTSQSQYKVDEPIFLQAEGNQDFYLYVFNTGRDGTTTMLIPNAQYTNNFFKAKTLHTIPDGVGPSMAGDQPGKETLMIVASATPMTFDNGFTAKGVYRQAKTKEVKRMFHSKDIRWVERVSAYASPSTTATTQTTTSTGATTPSGSDVAMAGAVAATSYSSTGSSSPAAVSNSTTYTGTGSSMTDNTIGNSTASATSTYSDTSSGSSVPASSSTASTGTGSSVTDNTISNSTTSTTSAYSDTSSGSSVPVSSSTASTGTGSIDLSTAGATTAALAVTDASTGQFTSNNQTSVISAPSLSDNKKTVSYLLEVQITDAKM